MREMIALITGITGFAGRHLKTILEEEGYKVFGISLDKEDDYIFKVNLNHTNRIKEIVKKISPDIVFHLAAQTNVGISWKKPEFSLKNNSISTINILSALREVEKKVKFYFMSSAEVYGRKKKFPIKENSSLNPLNPYALSKKLGEELVVFYGSNFKIKAFIGRAFNFTGAWQRDVFVLPSFTKRLVEMEKGLREKILYTGNLDVVRDFLDVRDSMRAVFMISKKGCELTPYNISSGKGYSIGELLDKLLKYFKFNVKIIETKRKLRKNDIPVLIGDNSKLIKDTGWKRRYAIDDTLSYLVEYWRKKIGR